MQSLMTLLCYFFSILSFMLLLGCSSEKNDYYYQTTALAVPSTIILDSNSTALAKDKIEANKNYWQHELAKNGVQVINLGEDYLLAIPSDRLFDLRSPRIDMASYSLLNKVIAYLSLFDKVTIKIAGYADCTGTEKRNYALSLARARAIADYLWSQDLETRLVFVRGYGSSRPITSSWQRGNRKQNERIEIIFRKVSS